MTTQSDTPGEGLDPKAQAMGRARQLVANYGSDPEGLLVGAIAAALLSPSVASDTAALPSGYEGLVAFIERVASGEFYSDYDGDLALLGKAREAIAALGRAPTEDEADIAFRALASAKRFKGE